MPKQVSQPRAARSHRLAQSHRRRREPRSAASTPVVEPGNMNRKWMPARDKDAFSELRYRRNVSANDTAGIAWFRMLHGGEYPSGATAQQRELSANAFIMASSDLEQLMYRIFVYQLPNESWQELLMKRRNQNQMNRHSAPASSGMRDVPRLEGIQVMGQVEDQVLPAVEGIQDTTQVENQVSPGVEGIEGELSQGIEQVDDQALIAEIPQAPSGFGEKPVFWEMREPLIVFARNALDQPALTRVPSSDIDRERKESVQWLILSDTNVIQDFVRYSIMIPESEAAIRDRAFAEEELCKRGISATWGPLSEFEEDVAGTDDEMMVD